MSQNEPERPVTMRDVAEKAGVNPSTVSRALRDDANVSKKRRKEIQQLAEEMGYRPNPFVQAFTAHVRGYRRLPTHAPIALLDTRSEQNHGFNQLYIDGARDHAHKLGYKIEPIHIQSLKGSFSRLKDVLFARGIRGLLIMPPSERTHLPELAEFPLAMATIDYSLKEPNLHRATPSYFQNMEMALRICAQRGYKRMGFCTYREEVDRIGMHWMGAFCGWRDLQPDGRIPVHLNPHLTEGNGKDDPKAWKNCRDHFYAWLDREQPDLIVANSLFFYEWLQERKVRSPEELGFVHLGMNPTEKSVSGVDQNHRQVGAAAVDLIINQLQKNIHGVPDAMQTVLIYGTWRDAGTTR
jgi:DNA-binding LacI/PurR family transcriptional regulator